MKALALLPLVLASPKNFAGILAKREMVRTMEYNGATYYGCVGGYCLKANALVGSSDSSFPVPVTFCVKDEDCFYCQVDGKNPAATCLIRDERMPGDKKGLRDTKTRCDTVQDCGRLVSPPSRE